MLRPCRGTAVARRQTLYRDHRLNIDTSIAPAGRVDRPGTFKLDQTFICAENASLQPMRLVLSGSILMLEMVFFCFR